MKKPNEIYVKVGHSYSSGYAVTREMEITIAFDAHYAPASHAIQNLLAAIDMSQEPHLRTRIEHMAELVEKQVSPDVHFVISGHGRCRCGQVVEMAYSRCQSCAADAAP